MKRLKYYPVRKLGLEQISKEESSLEDPRSQQSKLIVPGEVERHGLVKKRRTTKPPVEQYPIDSGKEDNIRKLRSELSTAMQQNQHVVAQGTNLWSQAETAVGTLASELKQELLAKEWLEIKMPRSFGNWRFVTKQQKNRNSR